MELEFIITVTTIFALAFLQNISFSIVSRSRNRDNVKYHLIASFFSNTIWFLTFRELILADMSWSLFIPYAVGTMLGSVTGANISMRIEKWLGATSDGHVKKYPPVGVLRWHNHEYWEVHDGKGKWSRFDIDKNIIKMGYYINYKLDIEIKEPTGNSIEEILKGYSKEELIDLIINRKEIGPDILDSDTLTRRIIEEYQEDCLKYALGSDGNNGESCKWYKHHDHMTAISKKYPDALFTLKCEGEDAGDNWTKYYRAGKCQEAKTTIVIDEFDESKLI